KEQFGQLCESASVIAWDFNAAQPGSGLSSLMKCPYFPIIAQHGQKVFFVSDDGASFKGKLAELYLDVAVEVSRQMGSSLKIRPWFVYDVDGYDARYSRFIELVRKDLTDHSDGRALLRQWKHLRLSNHPPFDENSLMESYERIKASTSL